MNRAPSTSHQGSEKNLLSLRGCRVADPTRSSATLNCQVRSEDLTPTCPICHCEPFSEPPEEKARQSPRSPEITPELQRLEVSGAISIPS